MIELTRGDTLYLQLTIIDENGNEYIPKSGDKLIFTVKSNVYSKEILIEKEILNNNIKIEPEDTKKLSYGSYVYDVQLTFANGDVCTIIKPDIFKITSEVSW